MTEAMLYDQPASVPDNKSESIVEFVEQNKDNEKIKGLYDAWEKVCSSLNIDIMYVRWKLDPWFQQCYHSWQDLERLNSEVSYEMAKERKEKLFDQFSRQLEEIANQEKDNFINKLKIETARDEIMKEYCHHQEDWIDKAVECVKKENQLIAHFKQVKLEEEMAEANQKIEEEIEQARDIEKKISQCLEKMNNEVTNWNQHYKNKEDCQSNLTRLKELLNMKDGKGRMVSEVKQLEKKIQEWDKHLKNALDQIQFNHKEIVRHFGDSQTRLTSLVTELVDCVLDWKKEFKFQFVELIASPNLTRIAAWCAQVGRLIYDLINVNLARWSNILNNIDSNNNDLVHLQNCFCELLAYFLQSTFVVTEQESFIIKVDKKHLPKFVVRMLAAENFPERNETITAEFAFEDDINTCCHDNNLDLLLMKRKIEERTVHLVSNVFKFESGKKKEKCEASFTTLHFKGKFSRQNTQTGKQVHEEKSRIIFTTTINGQQYWTLSLPLVVTTGANQGCLSQASVMWQCYSTDVYSVPIAECSPLPWCEVAEMLQAKIQKLCPCRKLTAENINHLKRRLFGGADVSDEEMVTLKKFCFDKLEKMDDNTPLTFSFWKWFIGIYNLLDRYLLSFWKDGLIEGFINKEDAKEKLKRCKFGRSGTFLLRFSDQNITDSQGVKSVFGHLTACVLIIKEEVDGRKKKKIYDMDVAGHKKLKEKNLANILKETQEVKSWKIYQYLYPGDRTREETFDKYCDKEAVVPGYTGIRDAFVVQLDQQLAALEISCGKHTRSPSVDSGIDTSSPFSNGQTSNGYTAMAAKVKKQRVSSQHPTIAKILQQGNSSVMGDTSECSSQMEVRPDLSASPLNNSFSVASQVNPGQSPSYFGSSPASQTMSPAYAPTPSPANSILNLSHDVQSLSLPANLPGHEQSDMSGQESPTFLSLPTVIDEAVLVKSKSAKRNMVPVVNKSQYPTDNSNSITTNQSSQVNGDGTTQMIIDGSPMFLSYETGSTEVIIQQLSEHSCLESNQSSHSAALDDQPSVEIAQTQDVELFCVEVANDDLKSGEPVSSTVPDQQEVLLCQPPRADLEGILSLLCKLQPDELKLLQSYLDQNGPVLNDCSTQMSSGMNTTPVCPVVTASNRPILSSFGSFTEAFNFSQREIAEGQEMNSGTIDTSVFSSVETSSGGLTT